MQCLTCYAPRRRVRVGYSVFRAPEVQSRHDEPVAAIMTAMRNVLAVVVLSIAAISCGSDNGNTKMAEDPYAVYLRNAPAGEKVISREDAQTRALLGCNMKWAPGTVDAVLADAYRDLCKK